MAVKALRACHVPAAGGLRAMLFYCICDALQPGHQHRSRHCQIQPDIAFGISYKQLIAALQQHTCVVCEEHRQILNIRQHLLQIDPCEIGGIRNFKFRIRKMLCQELLDRFHIIVDVQFQFRQPLGSSTLATLKI